jgi:hypothetical protein
MVARNVATTESSDFSYVLLKGTIMNYALVNSAAAAGSDLGIIAVSSDGTVRPGVYDILIGSDAAPADIATEFQVNRNTTEGVGGNALTPQPLDPIAAAASCTGTSGLYSTTQPVDTASTELLNIALNQRATFRWVAAPGSELFGVLADNSGIFLRSVSSGGTPALSCTVLFTE